MQGAAARTLPLCQVVLGNYLYSFGFFSDETLNSSPNTEFQEKGLLATEAVISIPYIDRKSNQTQKVLAANSHYLEFLLDDGACKSLDELLEGEQYRVVVTTGAGLYRYQLQDRIVVTGKLKNTPTIEFVGKEDSISDFFGEKLSDSFVAVVLNRLLELHGIVPRFAMLAPDQMSKGLGYTLFIQGNGPVTKELAYSLDAALSDNPHYKLCRQVGQLLPVSLFEISSHAGRDYINRQLQNGRNLGDIKPVSLSNQTNWNSHFEGRYVV